jgi:hypothetical protein
MGVPLEEMDAVFGEGREFNTRFNTPIDESIQRRSKSV